MSESILAAVIGGVATIVAAIIMVWATRPGRPPPRPPNDKPPKNGTKLPLRDAIRELSEIADSSEGIPQTDPVKVWCRADEMATKAFGEWLVSDVMRLRGFNVQSATEPEIDLVATREGQQRAIQVRSRRIGPNENPGVLIAPPDVDRLKAFSEQKGTATFFARILIVPHERKIHLVIIRAKEVSSVLRRVEKNYRKDINELINVRSVYYRCWPR